MAGERLTETRLDEIEREARLGRMDRISPGDVERLVAAVRASQASPPSAERALRAAVERLVQWDEKRAKAETAAVAYSVEAIGAVYEDRANIWEDCADALRATLAAHPEAPPESAPAPSTVEAGGKLSANSDPSPPAETAPVDVHEGLADALFRRADELDPPAPAAPEVDLGEVPERLDAFGDTVDREESTAEECTDARECVLAAVRSLVERARREGHEEAARLAEEPADWLPTPYQKRLARQIRALTPAVPGAAPQSNDPAPLPGLEGFDVGWRAAIDAVAEMCTALAVDNENPAARRAYVFVCQKLPSLTALGPTPAAVPGAADEEGEP